MRRALVLHLYYEDIALDLLDRLAGIGADMDVFVTGPLQAHPAIAERLDRLDAPVEWIAAPSVGFDVAPFLSTLRVLEERGYDLFLKLHTKAGSSGFGRQWRETALRALAGSPRRIGDIANAFAREPDLLAVGPAELFLSAEINMLRNAANISALAATAFPAAALPRDWGFFAGTMLWGRVAAFAPFLRLAEAGVDWEPKGGRLNDGQPAHAVERLLGLAPLLVGGRVGVVDGGGKVMVPAPVRRVPILSALAELGRPPCDTALSARERRAVIDRNPLLHYLTARPEDCCDPNPFVAEEWYRLRHPHLPPGEPALVRFAAQSGAIPPAPGPLFEPASYLKARPWLRRLGVHPLRHALTRPDWEPPHPKELAPDALPDWRLDHSAGLSGSHGGVDYPASIAIRIAAPRDAVSEWGDVHFARGLAAAFRRHGHDVRIDFRDDWDEPASTPDLVLHLRGPVPCTPVQGTRNILWIISHPDQVAIAEMEAFDQIMVASEGYAKLLSAFLGGPVFPLLQATDRDRFAPPDPLPADRKGVLFVGNRRGEDRTVIRWAIEAGLTPEIYGFGWDDIGSTGLVRGDRIDNRKLAARYAAAAAVLNDHWPAMRDFGFVSNRLFDVLASGGVPVSDAAPAVDILLPGMVIEVVGRREVAAAVVRAGRRSARERGRFARSILSQHTLDHRARAILGADRSGSGVGAAKGPRVHLIVDEVDGELSAAAFSRLIAPLTRDEAMALQLSWGPPVALGELGDCDLVILQSATTGPQAAALLGVMEGRAARLIVDLAEGGAPPPTILLRAAAQIWAPRPGLVPKTRDARVEIVPDSIDPRLWRDYHRPPRYTPGPILRFWLPGPARLDGAILNMFDRIEDAAPGTFELWSAGASNVERPWLRVTDGPSSYPKRARWLRDHDRFDVALCLSDAVDPVTEVAIERCFLEASALGLLSVVSGPVGRTLGDQALAIACADLETGLQGIIEQIFRDPLPFRAVAAGATAHVWEERGSARTARLMASLIKGVLGDASGPARPEDA